MAKPANVIPDKMTALNNLANNISIVQGRKSGKIHDHKPITTDRKVIA